MSHPVEHTYTATPTIIQGQFQLADYNVVPEMGTVAFGFIVPLVTGGVSVICGIDTGPIRLGAQVWDAAPPDESSWDEMAEADFDAPIGSVRVVPLFDGPVPEIPSLTSGPGRYRVRVHARGRDKAPHRIVDAPTEEYLVQVWPVPPDSAVSSPPRTPARGWPSA